MNLRRKLARMLLRIGIFIQSLPVVIMKPDDLIEFSRQTYANPDGVDSWAKDNLVDSDLSEDETNLINTLPDKKGKLLLLGVGGGREAISFSRMGFQVTGVDFVGAMVEKARENAKRREIEIEGLIQDISNLNVPAGAYDVVWLSRSMYSCVPSRRRRIEMVKRIASALKPDGYFLCQFYRDVHFTISKKGLLLRRLIAILSFGNMNYEPGDKLLYDIEFIHAFSSEEDVRSELEEGGFQVLKFHTGTHPFNVGVNCRKIPS